MKDTSSGALPAQEEENIMREINLNNIVCGLFDLAKDRLSNKELEWLSSASYEAEIMVDRLSDVTNGIACLVWEDEETGAGNFRDATDLGNLLIFISNSLSNINTLLSIGNLASTKLKLNKLNLK
jgi:hypothetical protein